MRTSVVAVVAVALAVGWTPHLAPAAAAAPGYDRAGSYDAFRTIIEAPDYNWGPMIDGVPIVAYPWGLSRNPAQVAQYGLVQWSVWLRQGKRAMLRAAVHAADWLLFTQRGDGRWPYGFDFAAPGTNMVLKSGWASGMAQGQGISLLTRVYRHTHDRRYLRAARLALRSLFLPVGSGGLARRHDGGIWFEEYPTPKPSLVLNGNLQTLIGLWDFSDLDTSARQLFRRGMRAVLRSLPEFDAGGGRSWYDLVQRVGYPAHLAPDSYTPLIQGMLRVLNDVAPHRVLRRYEATWDGG